MRSSCCSVPVYPLDIETLELRRSISTKHSVPLSDLRTLKYTQDGAYMHGYMDTCVHKRKLLAFLGVAERGCRNVMKILVYCLLFQTHIFA